MTTQLSMYNNALVKHLGERKLTSLTESRKPRRVLDTIWDNGFLEEVLEDGFWNSATRSMVSEYEPSVDPDFGHQYGHTKPADWVRTSAISLDEYFGDPLTRYEDEAGFWWTDAEVIYVRYVSSDTGYGLDLTSWPPSLIDYAETKLASLGCMDITKSQTKTDKMEAKARRSLKVARGKDAMNDPAKYPQQGSWVRARRGRVSWRPPTNIRTI